MSGVARWSASMISTGSPGVSVIISSSGADVPAPAISMPIEMVMRALVMSE